ncbi:unnamed protein product [Rhizophagus irregularis]|nr:unnamed protein product [Rhizophagus irregularis]
MDIFSSLYRQSKKTSDKKEVCSKPNKRVIFNTCQLCLDSQKTPRPTQEELAALYKIKQNTVSDIKDKWLLGNPDSEDASKQTIYFPQVEEALSLWITNALAAVSIKNFSEKRSHDIKWSEAKNALLETLDEERDILREIIKDYDLNDVFNCDETGLYWDGKNLIRFHSFHSKNFLSTQKRDKQGPLSGTKKSKKRVTLLFTYNATGAEKLKPLFIHKYQNPRAYANAITKSQYPFAC